MSDEDKTEITLKTVEGVPVCILCGNCGAVIKQANIFCYPRTMYSFICDNCRHITPLFSNQYDALEYYKYHFGCSRKWIDKDNLEF